MATFTLDALKSEVSKKYESTVVTDGDNHYELPNILQLPEKKRDEVLALVDQVDEDSAEDMPIKEQLAIFKDLVIAAEKNDKGEQLLELLGDNTAMLFELVTTWLETAQVGEAELSSK